MKLTAIRLQGFKSFADLVRFPVDAPVTGIIGPNGCGKSNIIDAVRWVLGESSVKQLRAEVSDDVIFAGASSRRAANEAWVELVFDNSLGTAEGAFAGFAEIVIMRKMVRDEGSQYFINRQRCRRRDIVALLQGTGVGARSYAVIEQGMVGRLVESKPQELRAFLEEAAGVSLYRDRREESLRRMVQVQELLQEHEARLALLAEQMAQLSSQASVARQFRTWQAELDALSAKLSQWQHHLLLQAVDDKRRQWENWQRDMAQAQSALSEQESKLKVAEAQSQSQYQTLKTAQHAQQQLKMRQQENREKQAQVMQSMTFVQEQLDELAQALSAWQSQQDSDKQKQIEEAQAQAQWQQQLEQSNQMLVSIEKKQQQLLSLQAQQQQYLTEEKLEQARQKLAREQAEQALAQADKHWQNAQASYQRLSEQTQETSRLSALMSELEEGEAQLVENQLVLETRIEQRIAAEAHWQETQQQYETIQQAYAQALAEKVALESQLQALCALGVGEVASEQGIEIEDIWQSAKVDARWQAALSTLIDRKIMPVEALAEAENSAACVAQLPVAWREIIASEFGLTAWLGGIEPLDCVWQSVDWQALAPDRRYLCRDGAIVARDSVCLPSERTQQLVEAFARYQALMLVKEEVMTRFVEIEQAKQTLSDALLASQHALGQRREEEAQSIAHIHQQESALHTMRQQLQQQQTAQVVRQEALARCEAELAHWAAEKSACMEQVCVLEDTAQASLAAQTAQEKVLALGKELELLNQKALQVSAEQQAAEKALSALQAASALRASMEARELAQQQKYLARQEELIAKQATLHASHALLEESAWVIEQDVLAQEEVCIELEKTHQKLRQALGVEKEALQESALAVAALHAQEAPLSHALEAASSAVVESEAAFMLRDVAIVLWQGEALDEAKTKRQLARLQRDMHALGAVNLLAIEQLSEVEKAHEELAGQCGDLKQSLALLNQAIAELDAQTKSRLNTTFVAVNGFFAEFFPVLFQGGQAKLVWESEDILQAGLLLEACPLGKKVRHLGALSGGEKALTAIALVFAFFKLNPAPFCLLDEIDAPLDEGNVGRLVALLRELAHQTQFVVITHRQQTMAACDQLTGVTMSEAGVSRLVSVRL